MTAMVKNAANMAFVLMDSNYKPVNVLTDTVVTNVTKVMCNDSMRFFLSSNIISCMHVCMSHST